MDTKCNKYNLLITILICSSITSHAQQGLQLVPQIGSSFSQLNKNIFTNKSLLISPMLGLSVKKPISKNYIIGLEAQFTTFNLGKTIEEQYSRFITTNSTRNFGSTTIINSLLNFGYITKQQGVEVSLGAGLQFLNAKGNSLQIPNSLQGNRLTDVYRENQTTSINPMLQVSLTKSWQLKPCLFFDFNLKAQYIRYNNNTTYRSTQVVSGPIATNIFSNQAISEKTYKSFTFISSVSLRFVLGGCSNPKPDKPKEEPQKPFNSCFALQWQNEVPKDSCFKGDTLQFAFSQKNLVPGATEYQIYIAPVNDLNNEKFLYSLLYPAIGFTINPILLDANRAYVVIVKLRNNKNENECIQLIKPIKRCANCCKAVKLPE